MATVGLDKLYYAGIIPAAGENPAEYDTPQPLAGAISVDVTVEAHDAPLYADDGVLYHAREFKSGKITINVADIGIAAAQALLGVAKDNKNALVFAEGASGPEVAIGFRSMGADGKYRYYWLYNVVFGVPGANHQTKSDTINYSTPTIEGTIGFKSFGESYKTAPWKAEHVGTGLAGDTVANGWFDAVYEPAYT